VAFVQRFTHLSKLAFFLSLGIVATVMDACSSDGDSGQKDPEPSAGAGTSAGAGGASATGGNQSAQAGAAATGGTTGSEIPDAGADLWDVICE
jgi:hypothetical protein